MSALPSTLCRVRSPIKPCFTTQLRCAATSSSSNSDKKGRPSLELLSRPLGVSDVPTTSRQTWTEKRNALMDQNVRLAQRNHIIKEATKGYFTDLNATRRDGGKTWMAPKVMIRQDKALYFPDIEGTSLDASDTKHTTTMCRGRISVIAMLSSRISEFHAEAFTKPANELYLNKHPLYQYVQINLQENLLKALLVSIFVSSIRRTVPPDLHPTYLVSKQNMEYLREPLGMMNRHIGYVYLVDENLKVRWAGCADAKAEEAAALANCVGVLLNRMDKSASGKAATTASREKSSEPGNKQEGVLGDGEHVLQS